MASVENAGFTGVAISLAIKTLTDKTFISYAFQAEERIVCHPRKGAAARLDPIHLKVGCLGDIAEVITL